MGLGYWNWRMLTIIVDLFNAVFVKVSLRGEDKADKLFCYSINCLINAIELNKIIFSSGYNAYFLSFS